MRRRDGASRGFSVGLLFVFALCALSMAGCAGVSTPKRSAVATVLTPLQSYSRATMLLCLRAHDLNYESLSAGDLDPHLSGLPGLTGAIGIEQTGNARGVDPGPTMDGALLLFERTPTLAVANAARAVAGYNERLVISIATPAPKPPSEAVAASLRSIRGNVIVFWDYPRRHPVRSSRVLAACFVASRGGGHPPPLTSTRVHVLTPFEADGKPLPRPRLPETFGSCNPGSEILVTNVYTCVTTRPSSLPGCSNGCEYNACWRDYQSRRLSLVCLLTPLLDTQLGRGAIAKSEVRIRVANRPKPAKSAYDPMVAEPWGLELANGQMCTSGVSPFRRHAGRPPVLLYGCGGAFATGPVNRSHAIWTIKTTRSVQQATAHVYPVTSQISAAWFAGK